MSAVRSIPATPTNLGPVTVAADAPPGTWRHPKFDEIHRRLSATTFGDQNVWTIARSASVLALSLVVDLRSIFTFLRPIFGDATKMLLPAASYLSLLVQTLAVASIAHSLLPLFLPKDDLSDIPLTPTQRALLGLGPASQPATPGSQYVTPPKYARSSTPRNSSRSLSGSLHSSGRDSNKSIGAGASYSPNASPLFQKAVGRDVTRRLSYGTPSPLSLSKAPADSSGSLLSNTPSPSSGRGASVSLTSRWLYEKGRSSSGMRYS